MGDKFLGRRCKYADSCPVYEGKEIIKDIPLFLYRNVFCHRGIQGWENCEKYLILEGEEK